MNPWLKDLARCKSSLPHGVRVVRFSEEADDPADSLISAEPSAQVTAKRRR
jgi:hypothetical protein